MVFKKRTHAKPVTLSAFAIPPFLKRATQFRGKREDRDRKKKK